MSQSEEVYSRIIQENEFNQVRLTVNIFRGVEYIHLRKYYMDFTEEWKPSSEGIGMALNLNNSKELFAGLLEILSLAESKELIVEHFKELIEDSYQ